MVKSRRSIIALYASSENDAIGFGMRSIAHYCEQCGYKIFYLNLDNFNDKKFNDLMSVIDCGDVAYCMTWCGIGQDMALQFEGGLKKNLWEHLNIPMLKFHGDSPVYHIERHGCVPNNSVNIYAWKEHFELSKKIFPNSESISAQCESLLYYDSLESNIDFHAREKGKLYFLKNGRDPGSLQRYWREQFTAGMAKQLRDLSSEVLSIGLRPGKLKMDDVVLKFFDEQRIDLRGNWSLLCFYIAQMDDYLRRVKATMVARALLPLPVVIQGEGWEYLDAGGAAAEILPSQDPGLTEELYRTQLGVIDMPPNVDTGAHDRMCRAAGTYSFALTSRNSWLEEVCPALNKAAYVFHPESIQAAVEAALKDPGLSIELGRHYGRAFRAKYDPRDFVNKLSLLAEMASMKDARPAGSNPR